MSSESRLITLATAQDARQISELLFAAFVAFKPKYTPEGFNATTLAPEQVAARMSEGPTWIAHVDGRIAGTVSALPLEQEVYIRSMAVLPEARGTGVGTRLLQEVSEFAVRQKAHRMTLTTTPFLHEAIRLYERAGFLRLRAPLDLHGTPLFLMTRPLPPHPCAPCDGSASATAIPPQSASSD